MTKRKWLGSALNFFIPGLGNVYGRKIKRGILHYFLFFVVVFSLRFIAYSFSLFLFSVTLIVGYVLHLLISGYRDVQEDTVYERVSYDKWYVYVLIIILHGVLIKSITGKTLDKLTPINFALVPTPAMAPTLEVGDVFAFKKTKAIERNDVTVFWFPDNIQTMYIKRCIGLPGDSLQINSSTVFINGTPLPDILLNFRYFVTTDGSEINSKILEKNKIGESDYYKMSSDTYQFFLTKEQAREWKKMPFLTKVELSIANEGESESMIYPPSSNFNWNTDFYGPIYLPKKGDQIRMTDKNIDLYLKCIAFENELVERDTAGIKINGQRITDYQFKDNYFFMMGDNRHNSLDSRYWGLLPQKLVIGKAMYLYWGSTRDRIGKKVI